MSNAKETTGFSRRRFLKSIGAVLLVGGISGGASIVSSTEARKSTSTAPPLPWNWARIDPMEAGSRAYRYYHDLGG